MSRSAFLGSLLLAFPLVAARTTAQANAETGEDRPSSTSQQLALNKAREESISGSVAGASLTVTKTLFKYPLDTATVRLQMRNSAYSIRDLPTLFDGSYRGVLAPLLANVPAGKFRHPFSLSLSLSVSRCCPISLHSPPFFV
jgi:solute carrier family 25 S-adenosylmethionine transporter 26